MDKETFEMVDKLLPGPTAESLLEYGMMNDNLKEMAELIARRHALQPEVVIEWYLETLNQRVEETTQLIQKLTQLRVDNVGS